MIVLSLDGLESETANIISSHSAVLQSLFANCAIFPVDPGLLLDSKSVWAQVLTGKNTRTNGCSGFVGGSAGHGARKVFGPADIALSQKLFDRGLQAVAFINIPLSPPSAFLSLSDGSAPSNLAPVASYRPRAGVALTDLQTSRRQTLRAHLECDLQRLQIAQNYDLTGLDLVLIRLSFFDIAGHLFGSELNERNFDEELTSLGEAVDRLLEPLLDAHRNELIVVSCYGFERCVRNIDINRLLKGLSSSVTSFSFGTLTACGTDAAQKREDTIEACAYLQEQTRERFNMQFCFELMSTPYIDAAFRVPHADLVTDERNRFSSHQTQAAVHSQIGFVALADNGRYCPPAKTPLTLLDVSELLAARKSD